MAYIEVEGRKYKVVENLGRQGGYLVKVVAAEGGERTAVKRGATWVWWGVRDRLKGG